MGFGLVTPVGSAIIAVLALWEVVWKGIAMWKSARQNQLQWYIAILILNTAGILPIVYLLFFQKSKPNHRRLAPRAHRTKTSKKKKRRRTRK